jgi:aarF domain-containing kinase
VCVYYTCILHIRTSSGDTGADQYRLVVRILIYNKYVDIIGIHTYIRIQINTIVEKLVGMTKEYGALFQIPPYFAYLIRAYTVLEGLGRKADPQFSILSACYPYLARRLLTDPSPRTQKALEDMLYGSSAVGSRRLDLERLASLAEVAQASTLAPAASRELIDVLLAPEGNYVQQLLLEEVSVLLEALVRQAVADIAETPAGRIASSSLAAQQALAARLGPAAVFALPVIWPGQIASRVQPLIELTAEDLEVLRSVRELAKNVPGFTAVLSAVRAGQQEQFLKSPLYSDCIG